MQDSWQTGVRVKGQGSPREQRPPCSQRRLAAAQREHFAATQSVALRSGRCSSQTLSITAAAFPVCSGTFIGIMCPVLRNTAGSNRVSGQGGAAGVSAGASQQQHNKVQHKVEPCLGPFCPLLCGSPRGLVGGLHYL